MGVVLVVVVDAVVASLLLTVGGVGSRAVSGDPPATIVRWRETTCEQALLYRDHQREFVARYAGEFICLQDGEVIWHGPDPSTLPSRRTLSGEHKDSAIWLKLVDPEEREGEHFEVYEKELSRIRATRVAI